MYKKISKTIILVVFLAFFGIMKVNADSDVMVCYYKFESSGSGCSGMCGKFDNSNEKNQRVHITRLGTAYFEDAAGQYSTDNIHNWDKDEKTTKIFNASKYFKKNNKCPKYMIVDYDSASKDEVYFSDESHYDEIVDEVFGVMNPEWSDRNTFVLDKMSGSGLKSDSNSQKSKSCKQKSEKNYSDPNVVSNKPLESDFTTYSCGDKFMTGIPISLPKFTKFIYNFIQFLVPLILIILGTIDLIRSITGGKEDEIKKGQQVFIKRLIAGALVFFSLAFVKLLVSVVFVNSSRVSKCLNCFVVGGIYCDKENDTHEFTYSHISDSNSNTEECEE